ncbi:MAG: DUF2275 domain-containing protein [Syntrophobacterales bacterium]|nr:MAG: DUF2275 domain-containing protein [Syntrophobacterales bacterium]
MECSDIQEKLSDYSEGTISPEEKLLIDKHLKVCQQCNESLTDLKKAIEYVHGLEEIEPPPWLTQRVMARVRSEVELKRGILRRLFYPVHIKLPIEALAVILIAITTVYVFKMVQPGMELTKAPSEEIRPQTLLADKEKAPPIDEDKHVSMKPAEKLMIAEEQEISVGTYPEPRAPVKVSKREKARPSAGAVAKEERKRKALSSELRSALVEGKGEGIRFTLNVKEIEAANKEIEKAFIQLGGKIIKREYFENKSLIAGELDRKKMKEFFDKLELVGEIEERTVALEAREGSIEISVEISKKP